MFVYLNLTGQFAYNETFYNYGMLISQVFGTTINLFTLFIVWKYSPPEMAHYKKHLLVYVLASGFLDFGIDSLSTAVIFLPFPAGTCQGLLRTVFGLETFTVYIIMLIYCTCSLHFITANLIFYRWQIILPNENYWKTKSTKSWCLLNYGYMPVAILGPAICYLTAIDTSENVKIEFKQAYPNDSQLIEVDGFYWANLQKYPQIVLAVIFHTVCFIIMVAIVFFCSLHSFGVLQDLSNSMSEATRKTQKRFMHQLLIQTMVPMFQIEIPAFYWVHVVQYQIRYSGMQNVTNFTFIICCTHGAVASLFLLYMNRKYRQAVYNIFVAPVRKCFRFGSTGSRNVEIVPAVSNVAVSQAP